MSWGGGDPSCTPLPGKWFSSGGVDSSSGAESVVRGQRGSGGSIRVSRISRISARRRIRADPPNPPRSALPTSNVCLDKEPRAEAIANLANSTNQRELVREQSNVLLCSPYSQESKQKNSHKYLLFSFSLIRGIRDADDQRLFNEKLSERCAAQTATYSPSPSHPPHARQSPPLPGR